MAIYRLNGKTIHFVHIPKTGGSSVNRHLLDIGAERIAHPSDQGLSGHLAREERIAWLADRRIEADHTFTLLRDPVRRIISQFRFSARVVKPTARPDKVVRYLAARVLEVPVYRVFCGDGRSRIMDFDEYVRMAFAAHGRNPSVFNGHIRPQADYWDERMTTFVFEDGLERVMHWIDGIAGVPPTDSIPHLKPARRVVVDPRESTLALIAEFYKDDRELVARMRRA